MSIKPIKQLRCAIYTRKSTEHGLELEFNSLDAQREACEAYITSQTHEGWQALPARYDDPAFSGGTLDRPALQRLLRDIDTGLVDVIVVYKIDRLTRSLSDFAKLVEAFDAKAISFVAVTQQFNTTTSMGRLTLNVLLSFAQFERELSSERVRDKIAASRKKGKWTGGGVPLGYVSENKKLVIDPSTAQTVRMIFSRYLAVRSFGTLVDELNQKGVVTGTRRSKGKDSGGVPFTYGPLAYLLKNRTYLGETGHKGTWFAGEHEAIVAWDVFEQVQELLKANSLGRTGRRNQNKALLTGLLFDDRDNRMSPSFTVKRGVRYPSYVSSALLKGRATDAGSIKRVPAKVLETAVLDALRKRLVGYDSDNTAAPQTMIGENVNRIVVGREVLVVTTRQTAQNAMITIKIPWTQASTGVRTRIVETEDGIAQPPNPLLVQAIVRSHVWLKLLIDGTHQSIEDLASNVKLHPKVVRNRIRMAFLPPDVTQAILTGTQPTSMTVGALAELAAIDWRVQRLALNCRA